MKDRHSAVRLLTVSSVSSRVLLPNTRHVVTETLDVHFFAHESQNYSIVYVMSLVVEDIDGDL